MMNIELEQIEQQLEALRAKEAAIREVYWEEYLRLKAPVDERLERLKAGRRSGKVYERVGRAYRKVVGKRRLQAMEKLFPIHALADEARKLHVRRCNLLYQRRKAA